MKHRTVIKPMTAQASSSYESASMRQRAENWGARTTGPNSGISSESDQLKRRSLHAYRNNAWIKKGIRSLVSNEIGSGITPKSKVEDKALREEINNAWGISVEQFDPQGVLNFYAMQTQIAGARRMTGEVFIRRRFRRNRPGLEVPVQFQILESYYVPTSKNENLPNGNNIRSGIEFNRREERVAYWMYPFHPLEQASNFRSNELIRVPARDVIHHYFPTRPGQLRGEPDAAQSLVKAFTHGSYDDAELVRKETRASITGFIKREAELWGQNFNPDDIDDADEAVNIASGTFVTGHPGEEPVLFDADDAGQGYADFQRMQLMSIAAGLPIPYELLSGDWSKVNDRLVRAVLNEFRREVEAVQMQLMIPQVCNRIWFWWLDAAVLTDRFNLPDYADRRNEFGAVKFSPQAWAYVSPEGDVKAQVKAIESGLSSRERENEKRGVDPDEVSAERKRDKERDEANGLGEPEDKDKPNQNEE